jgi:hypothetical protein
LATTHQLRRSGKVGVFHLKRGDMARLVSEIAEIQIDPATWDANIAVRCLVKCEPLGRAVEVREWV